MFQTVTNGASCESGKQIEERGVGQRQVEVAAESIRRLASRVGPTSGEGIPREIRRHQWSALNVPLLWAAAEDDRLCPLIQWLREKAQSLPGVSVAGVQMAGPDAVMTGWESLRDTMRSLEIRSREQFAEWIHNQGFPMPRWGGHISARVQERILNIAVAHDARVSALESIFVSVTLAECEHVHDPVVTVPRAAALHTSASFSDSCWETLDRVDLREVFDSRFPVLQNCPFSVRGRFRQAVRTALEARSEAVRSQDVLGEVRGWKLFCLLPFWLLRCSSDSHRVPKPELCRRMDMFSQGAWGKLMREATASVSNEHRVSPSRGSDQRRAEAACRKVQLGEVSRARQCLTGASLAPGTEATFREMQSRRPQEVQRPIPREVLEFQPATPLVVDRKKFLTSPKSAPRGASPGPGGCTYEHLRILLDDRDTFELLFEAATSLAQASVPPDIASALMSARLTALTKLDGGVRAIATGCSLVARTLVKQFAAVSTRAGTDCVGHMFRVATDANLNATILSVDGIGAYDHVLRASMLGRLATMPGGVLGILPFVRLSYASPSRHSWWDEDGQRRTVVQAEGGEQGDPLMPLLFAIGIQAALEEVHTTLLPGEQLCAFLDDVYALCDPERAKAIHDTLAECLWRVAGIQLHGGKTKVWNKGRVPPPHGHQGSGDTDDDADC